MWSMGVVLVHDCELLLLLPVGLLLLLQLQLLRRLAAVVLGPRNDAEAPLVACECLRVRGRRHVCLCFQRKGLWREKPAEAQSGKARGRAGAQAGREGR